MKFVEGKIIDIYPDLHGTDHGWKKDGCPDSASEEHNATMSINLTDSQAHKLHHLHQRRKPHKNQQMGWKITLPQAAYIGYLNYLQARRNDFFQHTRGFSPLSKMFIFTT